MESRRLSVRAEGAALRVREPGRADRYVPARLVERAVVWGSVMVDTEAIGLLLSHGATVSFVARGGRCLGMAWAPSEALSPAAVRIAERRADPMWVEAYGSLLSSWVREARLDLVRRVDPRTWTRWTVSGFRGREWEAWRRRLFPGRLPEEAIDLPWRYLKSLVWEAVATWLLDEGLDPHEGVLEPRQRFGLVREMARPLMPWIDGTVYWGLRAGIVERGVERADGELRLRPAAVRRWTARFEGDLGWMEQEGRRRIHQVVRLARDWQPEVACRRPGPRGEAWE